MSATSQWAANHEVTVTLTSAQPCTEGSLDLTAGEFDATNLLGPVSAGGLLFEESGADLASGALNFSVVVDKSALKTYVLGALITGVSYVGPDGVTNSGSARIFSIGKPIATKGAFKIALKTKFTGAIAGV